MRSLGIEYPNYDADVAVHYRIVIHYEIKYIKVNDDDSYFACPLSLYILKIGQDPTLADLAKLSDHLVALFEKVLASNTDQ